MSEQNNEPTNNEEKTDKASSYAHLKNASKVASSPKLKVFLSVGVIVIVLVLILFSIIIGKNTSPCSRWSITQSIPTNKHWMPTRGG